jgi:hypothetical protein
LAFEFGQRAQGLGNRLRHGMGLGESFLGSVLLDGSF